uniref:Uncharacterized protein n=1 Tax=Emiliania huxleyi TaxID=2903 RepID=A0A6V2RHJ1_EMIHU
MRPAGGSGRESTLSRHWASCSTSRSLLFGKACAVGNAVRGCDTFLTALALQMEAESSRADGAPRRGFVFRYSGTGQAASDVPTQIATLICQHVKGRELPRVDCIRLGGGSLEQALKARAAEVGARVSATLAAATPHFAPFRRASGDADAVAGRLERLAVLPTLSRSNSFSLCERMAEGDRAFAAAYRSLKLLHLGPTLSSPLAAPPSTSAPPTLARTASVRLQGSGGEERDGPAKRAKSLAPPAASPPAREEPAAPAFGARFGGVAPVVAPGSPRVPSPPSRRLTTPGAEPLSRVPSAEMRQQRIAATITRQRSM